MDELVVLAAECDEVGQMILLVPSAVFDMMYIHTGISSATPSASIIITRPYKCLEAVRQSMIASLRHETVAHLPAEEPTAHPGESVDPHR